MRAPKRRGAVGLPPSGDPDYCDVTRSGDSLSTASVVQLLAHILSSLPSPTYLSTVATVLVF